MLVLTNCSEIGIKLQIDEFIQKHPQFIDHPLVLCGSYRTTRFQYRDISIRKWCKGHRTVFDACVEIK